VLVSGATGFVGRNICHALVTAGHEVVGLSRALPSPDDAVTGVRYIAGDVKDAGSIPNEALDACNFVVHCVGIITEVRSKNQTFEAVHVGGTRNLLAAAQSAGIAGRFVYVSAAGVSSTARAEYSRTKAEAERLVQESGIPYAIFRPSIIMGRGCEFVAQMEGLIRRPPLTPFPLPFVPVPGSGKNLFQPVAIDDLASCITQSLSQDTPTGAIYEIGGADRVTFDELLTAFQRHLGMSKPLVHLPLPLLFMGAAVLEALLPHPPITTDQLYNLQVDNVCDNTAVTKTFGLHPLSFEECLARIYSN